MEAYSWTDGHFQPLKKVNTKKNNYRCPHKDATKKSNYHTFLEGIPDASDPLKHK
jgi:hypothetical protein